MSARRLPLELALDEARGRLVDAESRLAALERAGDEDAAGLASLAADAARDEVFRLVDTLEEGPHDVGDAAQWNALRAGLRTDVAAAWDALRSPARQAAA